MAEEVIDKEVLQRVQAFQAEYNLLCVKFRISHIATLKYSPDGIYPSLGFKDITQDIAESQKNDNNKNNKEVTSKKVSKKK